LTAQRILWGKCINAGKIMMMMVVVVMIIDDDMMIHDDYDDDNDNDIFKIRSNMYRSRLHILS